MALHILLADDEREFVELLPSASVCAGIMSVWSMTV